MRQTDGTAMARGHSQVLQVALTSAAIALMACQAIPASPLQTEIAIERSSETELEITVVPGQRVILRLPPTPITSYRWIVERVSGSSVRMLDGGKFESLGVPLPGAKSRLTFRWEALKPGCDVYEARYVAGSRSASISAVDHFRLQICVTATQQ